MSKIINLLSSSTASDTYIDTGVYSSAVWADPYYMIVIPKKGIWVFSVIGDVVAYITKLASSWAWTICYDGNTFHIAGESFIEAYTFNGLIFSSIVFKNLNPTPGISFITNSIYDDANGVIHLSTDGGGGVHALKFTGSDYTYLDSVGDPGTIYESLVLTRGYVHVLMFNCIKAWPFDGTSYGALADTFNIISWVTFFNEMKSDGQYIYIHATDHTIKSIEFNSGSYVLIDSKSDNSAYYIGIDVLGSMVILIGSSVTTNYMYPHIYMQSSGILTEETLDYGDWESSWPKYGPTIIGVNKFLEARRIAHGGAPSEVNLSLYESASPITADFSADPLSGYAPLTVQFTDLSIGSPTSWDWDFGDGSSHDTIQNPSHLYSTAGTYTVALSVDSGASTKIRTDYITVHINAEFSGIPLVGNIPLVVQFTDESLGGGITSWEWDFDDGSSIIHAQNPRHYYMRPGTHTISLTVSNGVESDTETKIGYITVLTPCLSTDDMAIPPSRPELGVMYADGVGNYLFIKKGVRVILPAQSSIEEGSGFARSNGPTVVFD